MCRIFRESNSTQLCSPLFRKPGYLWANQDFMEYHVMSRCCYRCSLISTFGKAIVIAESHGLTIKISWCLTIATRDSCRKTWGNILLRVGFRHFFQSTIPGQATFQVIFQYTHCLGTPWWDSHPQPPIQLPYHSYKNPLKYGKLMGFGPTWLGVPEVGPALHSSVDASSS